MKQKLPVVLAAASMAAACSRVPPPPEPVPVPEPVAIDAPVLRDPMTEAEVRAFLNAEADESRAAEQAGDRGADLSAAPVDPADFDVPIQYNDRVAFWIDYFQDRHPERFAKYLARMGRYETMIRERLRERGMPQDLVYLALIESGFLPAARSHAGAVGLWQFIAATGRRYGLEVSRYVDERRDPVAATDAALAYLAELHDRFGSWYLALAAYNSGENRVERILREQTDGARGEDTLFWRISAHLPSETRSYVPKFLAAAILAEYRGRYGFADVVPEASWTFDVITVPDATDLAVIADAAGATEAEIERLNPQLTHGVTPPGREIRVRIPAGRADAFAIAYARIPPERRVRILDHIVRRGETLSGIAHRYGTTVAALRAANRLRDPDRLVAGRRLVIRLGGDPATVTAAAEPASYRVRAGDTLWEIARRHDVSIDDLRTWNDLGATSTIRPGQTLRIQGGRRIIVHRVRPGDTLWDIARRHGTTTDALLEWNGLADDAVIHPGERVEIPIRR